MTPTNAAELELSAHTGRALPCDLGGGIYKAAMLILRMYMKKLNLQNWGPSQRSHSQCETSSKSITTPTTLSLEQSSQGPMTTLLTYQVVFVLDAVLAELLKPHQQGTGCWKEGYIWAQSIVKFSAAEMTQKPSQPASSRGRELNLPASQTLHL